MENLSNTSQMDIYHKLASHFQGPIQDEEVFSPEKERLTIYPIDPTYQKIYQCYQDQRALFWHNNAIDWSRDSVNFTSLPKKVQQTIVRLLSFFLSADGIVNKNIDENMIKLITCKEGQMMYHYQSMMEDIHAIVYNESLRTYVHDHDEIERLCNATLNDPEIQKKAEWCTNYIDAELTFAHKLMAFLIVEGIFFVGTFAAINVMQRDPNVSLPGLFQSNFYIQNDEQLHVVGAIALYSTLKNKLTEIVVHNMVHQAVLLEESYIGSYLSEPFFGLTQENMAYHIRYVADDILVKLGYSKLYRDTAIRYPDASVQDEWKKPDFFTVDSTNYTNEAPTE